MRHEPDGERAQRPILLVPGWSDRARVMRRLHRRLVAAGWPADAVHTVEFRDRFGSNVEHAVEVSEAAEELLRRTSVSTLDVVAHSMGGLAVRRYLADSACKVRRAVFLGTPHAGTWAAVVAWGGGRREMLPGSEFLRALPAVPPAVACTTIRTPLDLRVFPGTSARVSGARDIVIRLTTHQGLLRSRAAFESILAALLSPDGEPARVAGEARTS